MWNTKISQYFGDPHEYFSDQHEYFSDRHDYFGDKHEYFVLGLFRAAGGIRGI
jgi:hypothetical protein